jgi:hypothetical protein
VNEAPEIKIIFTFHKQYGYGKVWGGGREAIYLNPKRHFTLNGVNERHKENLTLSEVNVLFKYRLQHEITFIINT